jgi:S-adenosyl methyltransferase
MSGNQADERPLLDTSVAHPARIYDYWLGGKDNFAADRAAGHRIIEIRPSITWDIRANRAFMHRAVRNLAEAGLLQFLDVGTGIPTKPNLHEVAQLVAPAARIVYVDNDPVVLAHARALLASSAEGATTYIDSDLRGPGEILEQAARTLDFARPVAVILMGILHLISDDEDPYGIVARLMGAVPSGSYLAICHPASDINAEVVAESARRYDESVITKQTRRSFAEVSRFFDGLEVIQPSPPGRGVPPNPGWTGTST